MQRADSAQSICLDDSCRESDAGSGSETNTGPEAETGPDDGPVADDGPDTGSGGDTPPQPSASSCSFNGQVIQDSSSVTAYRTSTVAAGSACESQVRVCENGTLTGTFEFTNCEENQPGSVSTPTIVIDTPEPLVITPENAEMYGFRFENGEIILDLTSEPYTFEAHLDSRYFTTCVGKDLKLNIPEPDPFHWLVGRSSLLPKMKNTVGIPILVGTKKEGDPEEVCTGSANFSRSATLKSHLVIVGANLRVLGTLILESTATLSVIATEDMTAAHVIVGDRAKNKAGLVHVSSGATWRLYFSCSPVFNAKFKTVPLMKDFDGCIPPTFGGINYDLEETEMDDEGLSASRTFFRTYGLVNYEGEFTSAVRIFNPEIPLADHY